MAYEASSEGQIRRAEPGPSTKPGYVLAQQDGGGRQGNYLRVTLCHDGKQKTWNVHVLVAMAFHGDRRDEGLTVDHRDTDTYNNRPRNLRWMCPLDNSTRPSEKRTPARDIEMVTSERTAGDVF